MSNLKFNRPPDTIGIITYVPPMPRDFDKWLDYEGTEKTVLVADWNGKTKSTRLGVEVVTADEGRRLGHLMSQCNFSEIKNALVVVRVLE